MPFLAAAGALGGGALAYSASEDATNAQISAAEKANALEKLIYENTKRSEEPFLHGGQNALSALLKGLGLAQGNAPGIKHGSLDAPFTFKDYRESPGYKFQLKQGENAVLNNASALGGVNSGNTLKALTAYGQGLANQDFQQAYNNYTNNQNNIFGRLFSLTGTGQNAAANLGGFGQSYAGAVGSNLAGIGNAEAAGSVSQGNILSNLLNNPQLQSSFQNLFNTGGGGFNFGGQTPGNNYGGGLTGGGVQI